MELSTLKSSYQNIYQIIKSTDKAGQYKEIELTKKKPTKNKDNENPLNHTYKSFRH